MIKQLPLSLGNASKTDVRTQFAALCFRVKNGSIQVLLITSRGSGRWILPKGWPVDGATPQKAALQEAWEEAGVEGKVSPRPLGLYSYLKENGDEDGLPCVAMIYAVKVKSLANAFPEAGQRKRKWVSQKKAAALVEEPELSRILKDFDPRAVF
ncbi:MAG: NUDIX hydrolase [Pseudomonadota bacterium]